jgi:hypothetical protein
MKLFLTGFLQVFFISVNTYFLAKELYVGVIFASFMISFIWTLNVKRISIGTNRDRIIYSLGATIGSLTGLYFSTLISNYL